MKLQPAMMFGENMVLQRGEPVPVWGRSVRGDTVTVTLGGHTAAAAAENGRWRVLLPPMEAADRITMEITSQRTGERLVFENAAIGEVWLAGGQSNMEFLLKYDELAEEMYQDQEDPGLRFFRYPQVNFPGCLEQNAYPDNGFWRRWDSRENRGMFSAVAAYMGRQLRRALGVPVGFIGVNWGGTPAAAWTSWEALAENPALKPVLDWYQESCASLDLSKYYQASDKPAPDPSPQEQARMDRFMMGIGLEELLSKDPPPLPPPADYTPYLPGPRSAVRPAGLYSSMLKQVAPYGVRGAVWYQGEDDDARGWQDFYDESMKALIQSWRNLWNKELPFLQVELAPFGDKYFNGAKAYFTMREKQRAAAGALPGVHNVCILDAGDEVNIHVRKKRPVGERLALLARKYVYGETSLLADSPQCTGGVREGDTLRLNFQNAGEGLMLRGSLEGLLRVTADGKPVSPAAAVEGSQLVLTAGELAGAGSVQVQFAQVNFCQMPLFGSTGLPAFPFILTL
mgnify:FL=1